MYTLYWAPNTGAQVVEAVLVETGAPYRKRLVDLDRDAQHRPEYRAINPLGQIPALELPDGTVITESAAMVLYLADAFPRAGLLPPAGTTARAVALRWLLILAAPYYEADLRHFYPERYTTDPAGAPGVEEAAGRQLDRLMSQLDAALEPGPYLLGDGICAIDLYLFMVALWHPERRAILERWPRIGRHARLLRQRPSLARGWDDYYPPERGHAWSTWTGSSAS